MPDDRNPREVSGPQSLARVRAYLSQFPSKPGNADRYDCWMPVYTNFACRVLALHRRQRTVSQMVAQLDAPESDVLEALAMLGLPVPAVTVEPLPRPTDAERAEARDRMPKRMAERQRAAGAPDAE